MIAIGTTLLCVVAAGVLIGVTLAIYATVADPR